MILLLETVLLAGSLIALGAAGRAYRSARSLHESAMAECARARDLQAEMYREWGERQARLDATLIEMQSLNRDFEEAAALFEYGATDEAIEVAGRWKERRHAGQ